METAGNTVIEIVPLRRELLDIHLDPTKSAIESPTTAGPLRVGPPFAPDSLLEPCAAQLERQHGRNAHDQGATAGNVA